MTSSILIVDDEPEVARSLGKALERRGVDFEIEYAHTHKDAVSVFKKNKPEVAILDLTIDPSVGAESGLLLLDALVKLDTTCRFIILTSHSSLEYGIEALKRGALSYHEKPGDPDLLLSLIKDGISVASLKRTEKNTNTETSLALGTFEFSTNSKAMHPVIEALKFAASHKQAVLLFGETGTGKGVCARAIHYMQNGKQAPFIRYQPNFANPDLVASELFGHVRGAFTGANEHRKGLIEEANNGTLFIDEIDAIPKEVQVALLEVLQEKTFRKVGSNRLEKSNFRLITALNKNPEILLKENIIRNDFYHRIAHFKITLPPLRMRSDDIPLLSKHFIESTSEKNDLSISRIEDPALRLLQQYQWPGNIRELQAVIEGACFRAAYRNDYSIQVGDIQLDLEIPSGGSVNSPTGFREQIKAFEEELVRNSLDASEGNQVQAAKSLQMDRTVFRRILERIK